MYLLDTHICIYALNGRHPGLTEHLLSILPEEIFVSSITVSELEYGAAKSHWGERTRQRFHAFLANFEELPFGHQEAVLFGRLRAGLQTSGQMIGPMDLMIASQGIVHHLTVVTHNMREFRRVPGLQLEDWVE